MEEQKIIFGIVGPGIGVLISGGGIFYLVKDGKDAESKKIYLIAATAGAVIAVIMILRLIFAF